MAGARGTSYLNSPLMGTRGEIKRGPMLAGLLSDPGLNDFSGWLASPDAKSLEARTLRSRKAHEALMRAQAAEAQNDNELLATMTDAEAANLFGTPRTEREARLQKIVQSDYNAKELGNRLIWTEPQKIAQAQRNANLQRTQLENYLDPLRFGLQEAQFGETQTKNLRDYFNQQALRQQAQENAVALQKFRENQIKNAELNRIQRDVFHGDTQANQGLQFILNFERMLQNKADEDANRAQRQSFKESDSNRSFYRDVAAAAAAGALPQGQIRGQFGQSFDAPTLSMLEGYARLKAQQDGLMGDVPPTTPSGPGFLRQAGAALLPQYASNFLGGMPQPPDVPLSDSEIDQESDGLWMDGANDFSAPPMAAPAMARRAQTASRPQVRPGMIVRDKRSGQLFQVKADGSIGPAPRAVR